MCATRWRRLKIAALDQFIFNFTRGDPPKWNLFTKNCIFILTCLNFSHLQSTLHLMQYIYQYIFSTAQNSFWTRQFWCFLVLLPFLCFTSSTLGKHFPLRSSFIWGNKKIVARGKIRWTGSVRHGGHAGFDQKLLHMQCSMGGALLNHEMGKCIERVFKKNWRKPKAASHNNASWCTDTDGFQNTHLAGATWTTVCLPSRR